MVVLKRFFIFLVLLSIVCLTIIFVPKNKSLSCFNIKVYTTEIENVEGYSYIKNGSGMIIDVQGEEVEMLLGKLKTFSAISFETYLDCFDVLSIMNVKSCCKDLSGVSNGINYYGYIDSINNYVDINGEKVNVQVYENNGKCIVGIPMIFGSY